MGLLGKKQTMHLDVLGMTCDNCVKHVTTALMGVTGVKNVDVDLDAGTAAVTVNPGIQIPTLTAAVKAAGYDAHPAA